MKFFTAILSALALASATPIHSPFGPPLGLGPAAFQLNVTSPTVNDTWITGSQHLVEWDTSGVPPGALNRTATLFLGYTNKTSESQLPKPLAQNVSLENGNQSITVPHVPYGTTYFVRLDGFTSSGRSLDFTIIPC